jgi:hypothetical protein
MCFAFLMIANSSLAKKEKMVINKDKTLMFSLCSKQLTPQTSLKIVVLVATKSESVCNRVGKYKVSSMVMAGFSCQSKDSKLADFNCSVYAAVSYYQDFNAGISFDRLHFIDSDGYENDVVYLNNGANKICEADKEALTKAGAKKTTCYKRDAIKM